MKLLGLICLLCVSVYAIKDNTLKANKTPKNAPRFVASCDKCVDYVNTVIKNLQDPAKIALIKEEIENVFCPRVAHPYECRLIASKLDLFIKELLPYLKSDEICKYLRFCNNKRLTQFHTVGQYFAEHFLSKLEGPKDLLCEECQFGIHELQEVVDDADTQKQIRTFISQNVCSRLGQYRGSCDIFVDDFLPDLFQELHNALQNPKQFCVNIQLCPSSMIVGKPKLQRVYRLIRAFHKGAQQTNKKHLKKNFPSCLECELFVDVLLIKARKQSFVESLSGALETDFCPMLPAAMCDGCNDFIDLYGPTIINMTAYHFKSSQICSAVLPCENNKSYKNGVTLSDFEGVNVCKSCSALSTLLTAELSNEEVKKYLIKHINHFLCADMSESSKALCLNILGGYTTVFVNKLQELIQDGRVCQILHAC